MRNKTITRDIVIIGGGAAGIGAFSKCDPKFSVLLLERDKVLGGILNQCIHSGFGLHKFKTEMTGPEYANRVESILSDDSGKQIITEATVIEVSRVHEDREDTRYNVVYMTPNGIFRVRCRKIIFTTGSYERSAGNILLNGSRPKGVMPAGSAQRYINIDGYMPGKKVFILGSGDIGLIMARRLTLEGASVLGVAELMSFSNGLARNITQCLEDFNIPLYLSHTIKKVVGKETLEKVVIQEVDQNRNFIEGTEKEFSVDLLLLSVGLIPETSLMKKLGVEISSVTNGPIVNEQYETNVRGIYAAGNALHVHDVVDFVSEEGEKAGLEVTSALITEFNFRRRVSGLIKIEPLNGIRYTVPQRYSIGGEAFTLRFRSLGVLGSGTVFVTQGDILLTKKSFISLNPSLMEEIRIPSVLTKSRRKITVSYKENSK